MDQAPDKLIVPSHVACVMDGNGRWAKERGLKRTDGHIEGEEALHRIVEAASNLGVEWLTVYAFSTENWKRPPAEVAFLMKLVDESILLKRRDEINANNIRVKVIGRRDWRVPKKVLKRIDETVEMTKNNTGMTLTIAFNYGSQAEIVDAVKRIVESGVKPSKINENLIGQNLYDSEIPNVDLWIRTSGEYRMSNFMTWQASYAEMVFLDSFWPEMDKAKLEEAIAEFSRRHRRFGGL